MKFLLPIRQRSFLYTITLAVLTVTSIGCASKRVPVPVGVVPTQTTVSAEEEQYGQTVFNSLTQKFPVDRDDGRINRTRDIIDKLAEAGHVDQNPWHVHVLVDDNFKNAAATRGNFIFVWTGMLNTVQDDDELATVLAHEMSHVLAGHTTPDPSEQVNEILAGVVGKASGVTLGQMGYAGIIGDLVAMMVRESLKAAIVNPESQRRELEADQVGLFLMTDAGYDPHKAVGFWDRVSSDPDFGGFPLQFLSSHPSSEERMEHLRTILPLALERQKNGPPPLPPASVYNDEDRAPPLDIPSSRDNDEIWVVLEDTSSVHREPNPGSEVISELSYGAKVSSQGLEGRWLRINSPVNGFVRSRDLAPQ